MERGWIDISTPIRNGMPHWPGDPDVRVESIASIESGGCNVTAVSMCAHTGTHICDEVQLCAQALCLEEMLGVTVPAGALFYGKPRRRLDVAFTEELRR
ncbi:MAG: Dna2/Cas4 domain-containing protein, partial [Bryobacterales bacterium]|nr:Dna2/Cas4 domain-containing protein [Bryobacterales bacterium]